ncbi:MAG: substrate-binding domain-containing protein, partial [Elusimicrobia bacterium]|nr:substrate-binding domain-containing protein [Elusimicrobiota bacterium]
SGRRKVLIGLSLDTLKEERWQHDRDAFVAAAQAQGADVLVQAANSDDTRQVQDVEALISRGVRVLVIVPHNGAAMAKAVDLAHQAGVPVIAYDRLITGADVDLYVTYDGYRIGQAQARFLLDRLKGRSPARVVRIDGAKTDNNAHLLRDGQDDVLAPALKAGRVRIVHEDWAEDWKPENAKRIMEAALTAHGSDVDAVLAANDGTAGGAIQALLGEGLAGKVLVTGQDAELAACQRIMAGTQAMTIYKPVAAEAGRAADAAVRMAQGRPVVATSTVDNGKVKVPSILLDTVTVTKDNMLATVVKDGAQTRAAVLGAASSR